VLVQWLLSVLLSTVTRPGSQPNSRDEIVTRTCIAHVLRAGLGAGSPEVVQLVVARLLVKFLANDSNLNSHQLQLALAEVSNLLRTLQEASSVLAESLLPRLHELLRHLSYGVRFEAAVTMEAFCHALPHLSSALLQQTIVAIRTQYEALASLTERPNGGGARSGSPPLDPPGAGADGEEEEKGGEGMKRTKSVEAERRYRICALHGNSNALVMLLKGLKALDVGIPPRLLEDAMAVAKQLVNQQFSPQMRKWATCVRAGWSVLSAILYQGSEWAVKYVRVLFQLFGRSMELEANRHASEAAEPSNLLESMLGTVLVFVRECPQVLWTTPGALRATVELLDKNLEIVHGRFLTNRSAGSQLRLALVKAMLMEAYAWLPPGSYPTTSELLFRWSVSQLAETIGAGASWGPSSQGGAGGAPPGGFTPATDLLVENSMLSELVSKEDSLLDYKSTFRGSLSTGNLEVDVTPDILAMQVHLSGLPLEDREKDSSICSGSVGSSKLAALASQKEPPTPLHANYWIRPPMPHPSARVRLLDASVCLFSATFGHQSNEWQTQAVEKLVSLLPPSMRSMDGAGQTSTIGVISVLTSEEERRRREERQGVVAKNVVTALLAALQGLPSHTDSRINVEIAWVAKMRDALLGLLGAPQSLIRRAACEGLALLARKMGGGASTDVMVQSLMELALRKDTIPATAAMLKGVGQAASSGPSTNAYRSAGATFALACLRRTLGSQIRLGSCWSAVQRVMVADVPQPLRTWGLHSLLLLLKSMSIGQNFGVMTNDTLQTLDTIMEILEAHFLGVWSSPQQGSEYEPGLLICLVRLMNALLPMIMDLQPNSPSIDKFRAMWEVIRQYDDTRVSLECLQFLELLALFCPKDVANTTSVINFMREVFMRPHKSAACTSTALSCLRCIGKKEARVFRRHRLEVTLFKLHESIASGLHWDQAPFWRFVAIPRDLEKCYYGHDLLLDEVQATLDVIVGSDAGQSMHYILLSRALILGASSHQRQTGELPEVRRAALSDDDVPGGERELEKDLGREPLTDKLRREAAELVADMPASRWQVKVMAGSAILQALRLLSDHKEPLDVAQARAIASGAAPAPAPATQGWLLCIFLSDILAVACSTASAVVDENDLPSLQETGVLLLKALVVLFGRVEDPDAPSSTGVLQQFISQVTSALTPSLKCRQKPRLVATAADLVSAILRCGLIQDPVVIRRLVSQMLPASLEEGQVVVPITEDLPVSTALRMHNVRLRALADIFVTAEAAREGEASSWLGAEALEALDRIFDKHGPALRDHWLAGIKDAVRLQHGKDFWPVLGDRNMRLAGATYDESCDPTLLIPCYVQSWPVLLTATAYLCNKPVKPSTMSETDRKACSFCLAVLDCAFQYSTDSGGIGNVLARQSSTTSLGFLNAADDQAPAIHCLRALDVLFRAPFLHAGGLTPIQLQRFLSALSHGPFLRPDSSRAVQSCAITVVIDLFSGRFTEPGYLLNLINGQAKSKDAEPAPPAEGGEAGDGAAKDECEKGDGEAQAVTTAAAAAADEEEDDEEEPDLWGAIVEVGFVPLCRLVPDLFGGAQGGEGEGEGLVDRESLGRVLASETFLRCLGALQYLPTLCPPGARHDILFCVLAVALRALRLAVTHLEPTMEPHFRALAAAAFAAIKASLLALSDQSTHLGEEVAFFLLELTEDTVGSGSTTSAHFEALIQGSMGLIMDSAAVSLAAAEGWMKGMSVRFFSCALPCRCAVVTAVRSAVQSKQEATPDRVSKRNGLLRCFAPLAFVALSMQGEVEDQLTDLYYSEVIKLILLSFTALPAGDDLHALQGEHLQQSLPIVIHFLSFPTASAVIRSLIAQSILSLARLAPTPFKEQVCAAVRCLSVQPSDSSARRLQVQLLSTPHRQTLESTLRAAVAASTSQTSGDSRLSQQSRARKLDISQYA
jgi:hypothetical protein